MVYSDIARGAEHDYIVPFASWVENLLFLKF